MSAWLAACGDDCNDVDVNQLDWFKIWDAGIVSDADLGLSGATWYQSAFQNWDGSPDRWPVTIPVTLKPGLYLIRHEILSIHVAMKPQFYPECANLNITGNGTALPPSSFYKKFPGAYATDGETRICGATNETCADFDKILPYSLTYIMTMQP